MKPIAGFDTAAASRFGEYETLDAGGYVLILKLVQEETSSTGKAGVRIFFDIAEGEHAGYYERQFTNDTRQQKRWAGSYLQITEGNGMPYFKGFITSVEESNPGYKWNWDERTLANKKIGGIFRREEYVGTDGKNHWSTKLFCFCSVDTVRAGVTPPKDKPVQADASPSYAGRPSVVPQSASRYVPEQYMQNSPAGNFTPVTDNDVPF